MKPLILIAALLALGASAGPPPSAEEAVIAAIHARLAAVARNDTKAWGAFVADDMMTPMEGKLRSKEAWMRTHASWPREVEYRYGEIEEPKVRIDGDTAIVTYRARQYTTVGGQTTSVLKWQIETHVRREGRWQLLGVADAVIMPEPAPVAVDRATLDSYVGEYEWAPGLISKIRREGDGLIDDFTGAGATELAAENATTFFVKSESAGGDWSRTVFVRDDKGRVTHYIHRELGTTDRIVKKIR